MACEVEQSNLQAAQATLTQASIWYAQKTMDLQIAEAAKDNAAALYDGALTNLQNAQAVYDACILNDSKGAKTAVSKDTVPADPSPTKKKPKGR